MTNEGPATTKPRPFVKPRDARLQMFGEFWHYFSVNKGAVIGLFVFALLILVAIFAPLLSPHSPDDQFRDFFLTPPAWQEGATRSSCSAPTPSAAICCRA